MESIEKRVRPRKRNSLQELECFAHEVCQNMTVYTWDNLITVY